MCACVCECAYTSICLNAFADQCGRRHKSSRSGRYIWGKHMEKEPRRPSCWVSIQMPVSTDVEKLYLVTLIRNTANHSHAWKTEVSSFQSPHSWQDSLVMTVMYSKTPSPLAEICFYLVTPGLWGHLKRKKKIPELLPVLLRGHWKHLVEDTVSNVNGQPWVTEEIPLLVHCRVIDQHLAYAPGKASSFWG
jgi:hypothetical protein